MPRSELSRLSVNNGYYAPIQLGVRESLLQGMQSDTTPGSGAYDFLNQQPTKPDRNLPLPKLPKLAWVLLIGALGIFFVLVVIALLFGEGSRTSSSPYVESLSYAQEITRVSENVKQMSQDPNVQGLASTTTAVLLTNNTELTGYLKNTGTKVDPKSLSSKEDEEVDAQLQDASQSNRLPEAYARYLSIYLEDYQKSLQAAYDQAGQEGKKIINEAYDSVEIILSAPAIKEVRSS